MFQSSFLSTHPCGSTDYGRTSTTSLTGSSLILNTSNQIQIVPNQRKLNTRSTSFNKDGVVEHHFTRNYRRGKFWQFFRWITQNGLHEDFSPPPSYYSPPLTSPQVEFKAVRQKYTLSPCTISNSSLRDVENGALEDELTVYMQELQKRERENLYSMQR